MQKIAIIILHFGNPETTYACLRSVTKLSYKTKSVFVVDNGTGNLDKTTLKKICPSVTIILNKMNLGFAKGNNVAIKKALGEKNDFILLLNNDATAAPSLCEELLKEFKNQNVGIVGPEIMYADKPQRIWFAGGKLNTFFCFTRHYGMDKKHIGKSNKNYDFITGACMMIKKEIFQKVGLLPEGYFLYWEDVDFCWQAKKAGFDLMLVNKPLAWHAVSSSTGKSGTNTLSPLRAYYYARNPFIFIKRNKLNIFTCLIGQLCIRLPYYLFQLENKEAFFAYGNGLKDGLHILFAKS